MEIPQSVRRRCASGPRSEGYTLLEVTMSAAVLVIVAMSSLLVMVPVSRQSRISREVEAARLEVHKVLGQLEVTPFDEITAVFPPGHTVSLASLAEGEISINYDDSTADPLVIRATLSWTSPDLGPVSRTFVTTRTR